MKFLSIALPLTFVIASLTAAQPIPEKHSASEVKPVDEIFTPSDPFLLGYKGSDPFLLGYKGRSVGNEATTFERDLSGDVLVASDEVNDEVLISRMLTLLESRNVDDLTSFQRRAIINGVDRDKKKPGFFSRLLTRFIYRRIGRKRSDIKDTSVSERRQISDDILIARDDIDDETLISRMTTILESRNETTPLHRRVIINGVDRSLKKPGFAAKALTKFIYNATGWKRPN